jgi:hypothetical protein
MRRVLLLLLAILALPAFAADEESARLFPSVEDELAAGFVAATPRESLVPPAASPGRAPRPAAGAPERDDPRPMPVPVRLLIRRFNE